MKTLVKTFSPSFKTDNLIFDMTRISLDRDCEKHSHSCVEIIFGLGGSCIHEINGFQYNFAAGDIAVIHTGQTHALKKTVCFEHMNLSCSQEAFTTLAPSMLHLKGFDEFFIPGKQTSGILRLKAKDFKALREILFSMFREYQSRTPGWQTAVRASFIMLTVIIARANTGKLQDYDPSLKKLNETVSYMDRNFRKNLSLGELAKMAALSDSQFIRVFKKNFNRAPIDYLIGLRLDEACRILASSSKTVSEAAFEAGFSDSNYFSRIFKNRFGRSPSEWRLKP